MNNLDASLGNQSILDESFSNVEGEFSTPLPTPTASGSVSGNTILSKLKKNQVTVNKANIVPKIATPLAIPIDSPIPSSAPVANQEQTPYYGGGGGGVAEEESKREGDAEKMLLGFKAKYVYGIGILGAAAFIYFKFIKK